MTRKVTHEYYTRACARHGEWSVKHMGVLICKCETLASTGTQTRYHEWERVVLTYSMFSLACAALQLVYRKNTTVGSQHTFPLAHVSTHTRTRLHLHSRFYSHSGYYSHSCTSFACMSHKAYTRVTREHSQVLATRSHLTVNLRLSVTIYKQGSP